MTFINILIYYELLKYDYSLNIKFKYNNNKSNIIVKFINYNDLLDFEKKLKIIDINFLFFDNCLIFQIDCPNKIEDTFNNFIFAKNTRIIEIIFNYNFDKIFDIHNNPTIKLNNLPGKINFLSIKSYYPFDLSNLPTSLERLRIDSLQKFNLEYLPNSIKYLRIINYNKIYLTNDVAFENLPSSIDQFILEDKDKDKGEFEVEFYEDYC
jgi:hypothetical protein